MKLGNKIRKMRIKAGLTQEQLAEKLAVSGQSVSKWENDVSMPDIMLLPDIAEIFGVSIDELFDLTVAQKLKRIENRIEIEEELSEQSFRDYESFLLQQLDEKNNRVEALSLLADLYHHRMECDSKRVSKYAREAILLDPSQKNCQWLLSKAEGHAVWDWNFANHSRAIDFYKDVIAGDVGDPKTSMPYYYLIDNLLADGRAVEAELYLTEFSRLPSANPVMIDVYKAYIALANYDVKVADEIIARCVADHPDDSGYLFEAAQYYARRCDYDKAIELYERSWAVDKAPRYTDALYGIAMIHKIRGDKNGALSVYDRILECLRNEWGYSIEDKPYIEAEQEKNNI